MFTYQNLHEEAVTPEFTTEAESAAYAAGVKNKLEELIHNQFLLGLRNNIRMIVTQDKDVTNIDELRKAVAAAEQALAPNVVAF